MSIKSNAPIPKKGERSMASKKKNTNPIKQISPIEYFSNDKERMPDWLNNHQKGAKVDFSKILASRIVYYPGSALEGSPIRVFNTAHAAHVYIYVDYGFGKEEIERRLIEDIPAGYHIYDKQEVSDRDILPFTPQYHLTEEERAYVMERYREARVPTHNSFGFLTIYERDDAYGEEHGAKRFAVLFHCGDAIATYDVIFGNTKAMPYACILDNYGFDGSYEGFCRGSLLEKIANRIHPLPRYLICVKEFPWSGYSLLKTVGGTYHRFVFVKDGD